jgi:aminoglycoside phosphotransferase (APT) family kinase protein
MDPRVLAAQLQHAFPATPIRGPLTVLGEGFGSLVVETGDGLVFRIAKHAGVQNGQRRERLLLPVIQRHKPTLRVPRVTYDLGASAEFPYGVVGYERLPGRSLAPEDVTRENRGRIAKQIARFLTDLHGIDLAETSGADLPEFPPSPERLVELWRNVSPYLARHLDRSEHQRMQRWRDDLLGYRQRFPYSPTLVHGDCWYENLLFNEEQQHLVGVLDFENASIGDPAIDLATQQYLGERFAQQVTDAYYGYRLPSDLDGRVSDLMGLRELLGLELGVMTGDVDVDALNKVRDAILSAAR